jgi:murein endopeptidase
VRLLAVATVALVLAGPAAAALDVARAESRELRQRALERDAERRRLEARIVWADSRAVGRTDAGRLADGVALPAEGVHFLTWDPVRWRAPNDASRRHATGRLVRTLLSVLADYRAASPRAARVVVGDLSRPGGGSFDARFGVLAEFGRGVAALGHVSHQNGLDADVYYPRRDRRERAPDRLADIDLALAQELVDRFVAAGARFVFVGPHTGLTGPPGVVQPLARHDDHLHVRLRSAPGSR